MKIDICEVAKATEKGLTIEEYVCLKVLEDGCSYLFPNNYFHVSMEYCDAKGNLTLKSKQLLKEIEGNVSKKVENKIDFNKLHQSMQEELFSHIGKKQIQGFGGVYFIPSPKELQEFLTRFWKKYPECREIVKIEAILLNHIERCAIANKYAPAVKYFIGKTTDDGYISQLYGAYTSFDEVKKAIEIKKELTDTKDLF